MTGDFLDRLKKAKWQSPQHHTSLPPELEAKARAVWERVRPWWAPTFERFEFQLTKDEHPEVEIAAWERIGDALDVYMSSHPTADRGWTQDILCMVSLGIAPTGKMSSKRRKMFKDLRRIYLRCGGTIKPLTVERAPPQLQPDIETDSPDPRSLPATPIEQVSPVDVRQSDWIILRDRRTRECFLLYPESLPLLADMQREAKRRLPLLMVEFDQANEQHKPLADHILKMARGEA